MMKLAFDRLEADGGETVEMSPKGTDGEPASKVKKALELLERRDYQDAVVLLERLVSHEPSAEHHGLLGTAYLLGENYEAAKQHLSLSAETSPGVEWASQLQKAMDNVMSEVDVDFPKTVPFSRDELLAPPLLPREVLLTSSGQTWSALGALGATIGRWSGKTLDLLKDIGLKAFGRHLSISDEVWTNWYRKPTFMAILTLAYMRERLSRNNLEDTYPEGERTAFQSRDLVPPIGVQYFRTPDGSWNDLRNPKEGAAGTRFPRNVDRAATWLQSSRDLLSPNPAEISQFLLARGPEMKQVPFLNLLAGAWIQFMVHDWVSHRASTRLGLYEIPLPPEHPARKKYHQTKMFVGKTEADPTRMPREEGTPLTYINEVTAWWDASQIYGSDQKTADSLRTFMHGKMRLDDQGLLPVGDGGIEQTGFNRNWWVGLSLLHTLFVKEHNAICDMLRAHYPDWTDSRLYNVARLINAALLAKIHTVEWTPAILPNKVLYRAMNANWYGLVETLFNKRKDRRTLRPFKLASPELGGIVGNEIEKHGVPYGLSEEFTEVYRMHELLPDELVLRRIKDPGSVERVSLAQVRQAGAHSLTARTSLADLLYSFGNMHPGALVLNNYPSTLRELSLPGNPVFDLGAVDILRARERGVPRYNEFRRQLGLRPIRTFEDLTKNKVDLENLKRIYRNVEEIDLLVGNRAETHRPDHFGFGETLFQVFILNASRRLQADRFFTDSFNAETYSPEGLQWIDDSDMKAVLLRHCPELAQTGLVHVDNAFEPWDSGAQLEDSSRHPLREFND
ncbi:peroxidase [Cystobacter fuscus]|uniref:peroxidase family protein n=1 Tax=Cystobacter fuscus TaxID=43 RepID=UPI002B294787|nr:peroxidase [Cystobacter fuscus]